MMLTRFLVTLRCYLWLLFALLVAPAAAQSPTPYSFSERVGPVIEPEERAYFGLFPGVAGFERAQAYAGGDSVRVVIGREAVADSVLTMARATAGALGRFVETFEQYEAAFYNPAWQVVSPYARADVAVPYTGASRAALFFVEGGYFYGQPAYASDSLLLLNPSPSFDWRSFEDEVRAVRVSDIEGVRTYQGFLGSRYAPLLGLPLGLLLNEIALNLDSSSRDRDGRVERHVIAASLGATAVALLRLNRNRRRSYNQAVRDVEGDAWFDPSAQPPEMPPPQELERRAAEQSAPSSRWQPWLGWLETGFGTVWSSTAPQGYTFFNRFEEGGEVDRNVSFVNGIALETAFSVRPFAWLGIGVGIYGAPTPEVGETELQEVAYSKPSIRAFADIDIIRLINERSPIGFLVGGGFLRSESVVTQRFTEYPFITYSLDSYTLRERAFLPFYSLVVEARVQPETALFARVLSWASPAVDVPLIEVESGSFVGPVYRVEPHTVEFGQVGFVAGIRAGL